MSEPFERTSDFLITQEFVKLPSINPSLPSLRTGNRANSFCKMAKRKAEKESECSDQSNTTSKRLNNSTELLVSKENENAPGKQKNSIKKTGNASKQKFEIGQSVLGHSVKYNQLFDAKVAGFSFLLKKIAFNGPMNSIAGSYSLSQILKFREQVSPKGEIICSYLVQLGYLLSFNIV
jgi:hypothetical protein